MRLRLFGFVFLFVSVNLQGEGKWHEKINLAARWRTCKRNLKFHRFCMQYLPLCDTVVVVRGRGDIWENWLANSALLSTISPGIRDLIKEARISEAWFLWRGFCVNGNHGFCESFLDFFFEREKPCCAWLLLKRFCQKSSQLPIPSSFAHAGNNSI